MTELLTNRETRETRRDDEYLAQYGADDAADAMARALGAVTS